MDARTILMKLRDGIPPTDDEIGWFAHGLADGSITDSQAGAFAMAVCTKGLGEAGRVALTTAMRDSGDVLGWTMPGPVLDKHSTGGVGDSVSLLLAPALAACGVYVPMISGRGLGHTGGTLDKLESIPGYTVDIDAQRLSDIVLDVGCAIIGATGRIAPADKRLYAVRDVTGTVESIDLITASILSKKLAAGLQGLVLDVKTGSGAFMARMQDAQALARSLVDTAKGAGCPTRALITDMSQPLGATAGNAVEVAEVMQTLTGEAVNHRLWDVTVALGGELLALCGMAPDAGRGAGQVAEALHRGHAADRFGRMVAALGGPSDFVERWMDHLPAAPVQRPVLAGAEGQVAAIDTRALGIAVVELGGGRMRDGDRVDPSVGLTDLLGIGQTVSPGAPLAVIHARDESAAARAEATVRGAYQLARHSDPPPLIHQRIA